MIITAKDILAMIEAVDPEDTSRMDEINLKVCEYIYPSWGVVESQDGRVYTAAGHLVNVKYLCYTRSRDALKAIRQEGWVISVKPKFSFEFPGNDTSGFYVKFTQIRRSDCEGMNAFLILKSSLLPTEELAELHATIQAIEWGREREND